MKHFKKLASFLMVIIIVHSICIFCEADNDVEDALDIQTYPKYATYTANSDKPDLIVFCNSHYPEYGTQRNPKTACTTSTNVIDIVLSNRKTATSVVAAIWQGEYDLVAVINNMNREYARVIISGFSAVTMQSIWQTC